MAVEFLLDDGIMKFNTVFDGTHNVVASKNSLICGPITMSGELNVAGNLVVTSEMNVTGTVDITGSGILNLS